MMKRMTAFAALPLSAFALAGCAFLSDAREDEMPSAAELGAGECRPAGPHDVAAPGEWICDRGDGRTRNEPRHRVENR